MSRGLGTLQRGVCEVLYDAEGHELPLREVSRRLGQPDRSNLRRGIRGLLQRGLVEEFLLSEERRIKLTRRGVLGQRPLPKIPRPRVSIRTRMREELRAMREAREEERRRVEAEMANGPRWIGYERRFVRRRPPGPTQDRVLSVLWKYADPMDEGLPVPVVKAIVGGNRSNTRRAIRMLLLRGEIEETEDRERIRLSGSNVLWFSWYLPPILKEPIDDRYARAVLKAHRCVNPARRS